MAAGLSEDEAMGRLEAYPAAKYTRDESIRIAAFVEYAGRQLWPLEFDEESLNLGACVLTDHMNALQHLIHKGAKPRKWWARLGRSEEIFLLATLDRAKGLWTVTDNTHPLTDIFKLAACPFLMRLGPRDDLQAGWVKDLGIVPKPSLNPLTEKLFDAFTGERH